MAFYGVHGPKIIVDIARKHDTMTENKHQYDGIYQARPGYRFWGTAADGQDIGIDEPKRYNFRYDSTDLLGNDWYRVTCEGIDRVVQVMASLLPGKPTCYVDKIGDLTGPDMMPATPVEDKHRHDGRYRAKLGYQFCGYDVNDKRVEVLHPDEFSLQYTSTDSSGTDWYRVTSAKVDQVAKILYSSILDTPSSNHFERLGDLAVTSAKPDEVNKHQHDGRYRVNKNFAFYGTSDQGDPIQLDEGSTFTFAYVSTHDGHDWYHVESEDVFCTMWVPESSFPGRTEYFTRLGDVPLDAPKPKDEAGKHQYDGRYRAKKNYRFVGTTASGVEVEVAHPDEFDFEYAGTEDGVDWYGVVGPKGEATIKVRKDCLPGVSNHFEKISDLKGQAKEPDASKHQHDGRYRAKTGCRLYCRDKADNPVLGFDKEDQEFSFTYHETVDGVDWYRVVSADKDCLVRVSKNLLPPSGFVERMPSEGAEPNKQEDPHRYDGTYRVLSEQECWGGHDSLGEYCPLRIGRGEIFTFRYCGCQEGRHTCEISTHDETVQADWTTGRNTDDFFANVIKARLDPMVATKVSDSPVLEDKMPDRDARSKFDGTYQVKPGGSFKWHGQGDDADVGPGGYFTFRHVADDQYEIRTNATTVVGRYFGIDDIVRQDGGSCCWLRPSNVEKISDSTEWDTATNQPCTGVPAPSKAPVSDSTVPEDKMSPGPTTDVHARHNGLYRVKPGGHFEWCGTGTKGTVKVAQSEYFTFRHEQHDRYEVRTAEHQVVGGYGNLDSITDTSFGWLRPSNVEKISDSTDWVGSTPCGLKPASDVKIPDKKDPAQHDGTYRAGPAGFQWTGDACVRVAPDEMFTFQFVGKVQGYDHSNYRVTTATATTIGPSILDENGISARATKITDNILPLIPVVPPGLTAVKQMLGDLGIPWVKNGTKGVLAQCFKCHGTAHTMVVNPDGAHSCILCGVKGTRLEDLAAAVKAHRAQEKTAPVAPKKEDTLDTTYKSVANASAMLKTLQSLLVFDVVTSNTCTLRAQCFRGCKDPRAGTLRIDVPSGQYRCTVCGVQGPDADHLIYTIKAHRANTSTDSVQKDSIMNTTDIKQAFNMTNHKALAAVKTGAEQAGAHAAHEVVIAQVEKLLGARFPAEFYATEIGRAVISMGSAYALLLTTQMVQHPLASKANHVAEMALTAATYESAGPLLAKAREFVEGTVVAAMGAGVDLGDSK